MYLNLDRIRKNHTVAFSKFKEYMHHRVSDEVYDYWIDTSITVDMAAKNVYLPLLEGYLMNFFNKYDIKIDIGVDKFGEYIPRVCMYEGGLYRSNMQTKYVNRHEAVIKAIDVAFSKLNVELILNRGT